MTTTTHKYTKADAEIFQMKADAKKNLIKILQDEPPLFCEVDYMREEFKEAGLDAFRSQLSRLDTLTSSIEMIHDDLLAWLREGSGDV